MLLFFKLSSIISNVFLQALFEATRLDQDRGIASSILETRRPSRRSSSQGRDKRHPEQSRKASPRGWTNGEAGSSLENTLEGTSLSSTASTTAIMHVSKEIVDANQPRWLTLTRNKLVNKYQTSYNRSFLEFLVKLLARNNRGAF